MPPPEASPAEQEQYRRAALTTADETIIPLMDEFKALLERHVDPSARESLEEQIQRIWVGSFKPAFDREIRGGSAGDLSRVSRSLADSMRSIAASRRAPMSTRSQQRLDEILDQIADSLRQ